MNAGRKRGRRPASDDVKKRAELSRVSARECRARKKLRYQYVEELVTSREKAIFALREELNMVYCFLPFIVIFLHHHWSMLHRQIHDVFLICCII